jgi:hypothetical protein
MLSVTYAECYIKTLYAECSGAFKVLHLECLLPVTFNTWDTSVSANS